MLGRVEGPVERPKLCHFMQTHAVARALYHLPRVVHSTQLGRSSVASPKSGHADKSFHVEHTRHQRIEVCRVVLPFDFCLLWEHHLEGVIKTEHVLKSWSAHLLAAANFQPAPEMRTHGTESLSRDTQPLFLLRLHAASAEFLVDYAWASALREHTQKQE